LPDNLATFPRADRMLTKLHTFSLFGIQAIPVEVEVDISPGAVPKTILVGLAEAAAKESIHRIERALVNCGFQRSYDKVVINLSPAELPKEAASFDLPVALGLLSSSGQLPPDRVSRFAAVGELALDGGLRRCKGALAMAIAAKEAGLEGLVVPTANAREAAVVEGLDVYAVDSLSEATGFYAGTLELEPVVFRWSDALAEAGGYDTDYADVKGQELAKRAVTVAAAGNHHILMLGPPGTGKTLIAQRLATILPDLTPEESLQTTQIYSAVGRLTGKDALLFQRPFRAPHHTVSEAGLVGGGSVPTPGELSLAHNGVPLLVFDRLPEITHLPGESNEKTPRRASRGVLLWSCSLPLLKLR
jgi:magnesium chelatase family protein